MKAFLANLIARLTSRTFWVAIATFSTFIAAEQYTEAAAVAIAYVLGEKALDMSQAVTHAKTFIPDIAAGKEAIDDGIDKSQIWSGVASQKNVFEKTED